LLLGARAAVVAASLLVLLLLPTTAFADDASAERKRECARTSEDGQRERSDRHFRVARQRFLACTQDHCPDVVRRDCLTWLEQMDAAIPTVVFVVHDARGEDVPNARVLVDGQPEVTGTAVPLDPGNHAVRAELPDGSVVTKDIQAAEAVKNRIVTLDARESTPRRDDERKAAAGAPPSPPIFGYALLGTSAVLVGVTAYLGLDGLSDAHTLRDTCKPTCNQDEVDSVRTQFRVSYVTGGLAALALGTGLYLVLTQPRRSGPDVRVTAGPARADVVVRF
jgi:hypothetical protein